MSRVIEPAGVAPPVGGYVHGRATTGPLLFVSGQTPEAPDGSVADDPEAQLRQVWRNVVAVLDAAGVGVEALVQVRTFLADRAHRELNSTVRNEVLGEHLPALTVVVCDLFDPGWVAEIEAVAELPG